MVRWSDVLEELDRFFKIPQYLLCIVESSLSDRELIYDTIDVPGRNTITAGDAHGSIVGLNLEHILWRDPGYGYANRQLAGGICWQYRSSDCRIHKKAKIK